MLATTSSEFPVHTYLEDGRRLYWVLDVVKDMVKLEDCAHLDEQPTWYPADDLRARNFRRVERRKKASV